MMTPQQLFSQAMALQQRGSLAEAEMLYRRLVAANPEAFAPRHMLGLVMAQQGRLNEARETIEAALSLNPRDPGALVNYGNVLHLQGRFEEAVGAYDRALVVKPDADTLNNRGNALHALNR